MLQLQHILNLKLDRERLLAHRNMPPPKYSHKELTSQISAIGDATISKLLGVPPELFGLQLEAAREHGASYLSEDANHNVVGISAATSLIKNGEILQKNVILPRDYMFNRPGLSAHYILGVFINGTRDEMTGLIAEDSLENIQVAGWIPSDELKRAKTDNVPPTFKTKLPVIMVPCERLHPVDSLLPLLAETTV